MPASALSYPVLHRFFFALRPDEITARRTYAFAESEFGSKGLLQPDRHHVTLALTNDMTAVPAALIDRLLRAGEAVRAAPFELVLDKLSINTGTIALRPSHVVRPLQDLQRGIAAAMTAERLAMREDWKFNPHETLAYRKSAPDTRSTQGFHWTVREFVLVHSHVGLHRHDIIGQWALCPPEELQGQLL